MENEFIKEIGLISFEQYEILKQSLVIIFGLGGVGGYTFEILLRCGISNFILIDKDVFEISNMNRQLAATSKTINKSKVDIYKERALSINKETNIITKYINVDNNNYLDIFSEINKFTKITNIYVADCIDDIEIKCEIIKYCYNNQINIISSMGTANHISTDKVTITDINKTRYCPIAKKIRKYTKLNNIKNLNCLFIDEEPINVIKNIYDINKKTSTISYVPSLCGIKIAEFIVKNLLKSI